MSTRHFRGLLLAALVILLPALSLATQTAPTFGPKKYVRTTGQQQTFTESFARCADGGCQLVVVNGNADGTNRASSASIYLNGVQIVGPGDFNPSVDRVVRPVSLADNDQLTVVLASKPGSFLTISVECTSFASIDVASSGVSSSIWDNGTVSLSVPLENSGNVVASNVSITNMQAPPGSYVGPTPFAYSAGDIEPDESQPLFAEFTAVNGNAPFPLTVSGTYNFGTSLCAFQAQTTVNPPPASNAGLPKLTTTTPTFTAAGVQWPRPQFHPPTDEPNAESQYFPPIGQPRNLFPTPPALSSLNAVLAFNPNDQNPPPAGSPNDVVFLRNQNGGGYGALPPDPSAAGATPGGFVMISANTAVSYSKDFGKTFTTVPLTQGSGFSDPGNPSRTDFFPENDGGLCCDQVVHYIPGRNLMVWLLQYWSPSVVVGGKTQKGQNRLRIGFATPEAAGADFLHAWSWFDVTPTTLGDTTVTDWFDYPDLAFSNDWLYISVDHGFWNASLNSKGNPIGQQVYSAKRWMVRASLNDMASSAGSVNLVYYEAVQNGVVKAHFAQSAPDTMYYAGLHDSSKLAVFADPDSNPNIPGPKDIAVSSYCKATSTVTCDYSAPAPDKLDWNVAPHGVIGATYVAPGFLCPPEGCAVPTHFVYFAFDGGRDTGNGRAFPYVRIEKIDADALKLISELDIWNPNFAFATAALNWRPNSGRDEVAISLATGGGGNYADNAVGFLGDFVVYSTTSSNATQSDGSGNVRYGDYFDVRNAVGPVTQAGQGVGYATLGYSITQAVSGSTCAVGGCNVGLQYVLFGRNADLFPTPSPPIH